MRNLRARGLLAAAALCLAPPGATPQARNLDAYASRVAVYRGGDFGAALRASMAFPIGRLEDQAEEYLASLRGRAPETDRDVLAAAMLHFDLAWAAGMEPRANESIGRRLLGASVRARSGYLHRPAAGADPGR
jgi:hypothetical protein